MRAAFGFGTTEAGSLQIVHPVLDVKANFLLHLFIDLRTTEKLWRHSNA